MMADIVLNLLRVLLLAGVLFIFWRYRLREAAPDRKEAWWMILWGVGLLLFGSIVDVAESLPGLIPVSAPDETGISSWLENLVGYIGGCLLLFFGFRRWLLLSNLEHERFRRLKNAITRVQGAFISTADTRQAFDSLLHDILDLTGSEYGFIGEVSRRDGQPYLKTHAISNIAWNEETRRFYDEHVPLGMEFSNPNTLFGAVLRSGEPVIANDPAHDPRRGGLPPGHPPLNTFLGLPIHAGGRMLGMLGIANRSGGYDHEVIHFLHPLSSTIAQLIEARQAVLARNVAEAALAASAQHAQAVLNHVLDGIITIDGHGIVASYNLSAERIFGYTAEAVIGRNVSMLMPAPYREQHDGYLRHYQSTGEARVIGIGREVVGQRQGGGTFPMELAVTEIRRDGQPLYIGMVRDITERKRMERLKSEFLSTVSHELRTPLTSIHGALGLIAGGVLGALPAQIRQLVHIAHKNSEQLTHLINDLLDMEKMAAGGVHFDMKAEALMPLLEQAIEANRAYGEDRRVSFVMSARADDVLVRVDAKRLLQVMANLLSNAAKFSPEGGQVEIAVTRLDSQARIAVSDHGPGIPANFRDHIFEKFSQADASDSRQKGGTGLGLAITRELVQHMDGRIGFDSRDGEGATFHIELPLLRSSGQRDWPGTAEPEITNAPRLLVVEDNAEVAGLLALMLRYAGFNVDLAGDARSALARLETQAYAAMTLDLNLPDTGGVEIIRKLRASPATRNLPIIVLSAYVEEGQLALAGELNTVDWLAKPFDEARLLRAVRQALRGDAAGKPRVLHVEDDVDLRQVVSTLGGEIAEFVPARNLAEARERLREGRYSVVMLDLELPDGSGWELMSALRAVTPMPRVIILSGSEAAPDQVEAVAAALVKSRISNDELLQTLHRVISQSAALSEQAALVETPSLVEQPYAQL
ncbi:MAG: response regulator [Gallionellaceae bacterium]|nr:response regulator [Gallionellaceae bacterium]